MKVPEEIEGMLKALKPDVYSLGARTCPMLIMVLPILLVMFIILHPILPEEFNWKRDGSVLTVLVYVFYWTSSQVGGDFGKKRENVLWEKWGGAPTTRFLRHGNDEYNAHARDRVHKKLRSLGHYVPTRLEQERNPQEADDHYRSCTLELIRRTRDKKRFPAVFRTLTEYGFRRNAYGLKSVGLASAVLSLVVCSVFAFYERDKQSQSLLATEFGLINIVLVLLWFFWITEKAVKITADRYAHSLLEASLELEVENGNNPLPER